MTPMEQVQARAWTVLERMEGWCSKDKSDALIASVVESRPRVLVEIGVFGGRSLVALAMAAELVGHGRVYGIDPMCKEDSLHAVMEPEHAKWWAELDYEKIHAGCQRTIVNENLSPWCSVFRATSERAQYLFDEVDLLHVDGNHSEEASTKDVFMWLPKMRPGSFLWFDDIDWPSTRKAQELLATRCTKVREVGTCALYRTI